MLELGGGFLVNLVAVVDGCELFYSREKSRNLLKVAYLAYQKEAVSSEYSPF